MIKTKVLKTLFTLILLANCTKIQYVSTKITVPPQNNINCVVSGFKETNNDLSMEDFAIVLTDTQCLAKRVKSQKDYIDLLLNIMNKHNRNVIVKGF